MSSNSNIMPIVGMDPSLSNFGVVRATLDLVTLKVRVISMEVVVTKPEADKAKRKVVRKNSEDLERAKVLHAGAIKGAAGAQLAFIEVPVGGQDARAVASYGVCLGVIAAVDHMVPIIQVTPTQVKIAGAGTKTATKGEMIEAMVEKYPDAPWPMRKSAGKLVPIAGQCEHLADALAAIEAGLESDEFAQMMALHRRMVTTAA